MKNEEEIKRFLHEQCVSRINSAAVLERQIKRLADENKIKVPDDSSTYRRLYNGDYIPTTMMLPLIANALELSVMEIYEAKRYENGYIEEEIKSKQKEIDELNEILQKGETERNKISKLLWLKKQYMLEFGGLLLSFSLYLFGVTYKIAELSIVGVVLFITCRLCNKKQDNKKEQTELTESHGVFKRISCELKQNKDFFKELLTPSPASRIVLNITVGLMMLALFPIIEYCFYGTKYSVSAVICGTVGFAMTVMGIIKTMKERGKRK